MRARGRLAVRNGAAIVMLAGLCIGCGGSEPPQRPAEGGPRRAVPEGPHPVDVSASSIRPLPPEEADAGVDLHSIDGRVHRVASGDHPYLSVTRARSRIQRRYASEQHFKIRRGLAAAPGEWPWAVAFLNRTSTGEDVNCGGALIAPQWVLTAAHCDIAGQDEAIVGSTDLADPSQGTRTGIEQVCIHPQFDSAPMDWDVALVRIKTTLTTTQLERTPGDPQWELAGTRALTIGWGRIDPAGNYTSTLQEVDLPLVQDATCSTVYPNPAYPYGVTPRMLCVGGGPGGSCDGDSGGPLMVQDTAARRWLGIGIVSWGSACDPGAPYGVYGRVSQFNQWIERNLSGVRQCKD